jgi:hypothetical protein
MQLTQIQFLNFLVISIILFTPSISYFWKLFMPCLNLISSQWPVTKLVSKYTLHKCGWSHMTLCFFHLIHHSDCLCSKHFSWWLQKLHTFIKKVMTQCLSLYSKVLFQQPFKKNHMKHKAGTNTFCTFYVTNSQLLLWLLIGKCEYEHIMLCTFRNQVCPVQLPWFVFWSVLMKWNWIN